MARWVTVRKDAFPFNYRVPSSGAWLHFKADELDDSGERFVPDDQADFIIARGYGVEGKASGSTTKSRKGKTSRRKKAKVAPDAKPAADTGSNAVLADAPVVPAGSADDRDRLDQTAG